MQKPARKNAFTLIELLVVIAIVGVLAAVVLIAINPARRMAQARDSGRKSDVGQLATAAQAYYTTYARYPTTLGELTASGDLKQIPSTSVVSGCSPSGAASNNYAITYNSSTSEAVISVCIEAPTTATEYTYWVWRSSTGAAGEVSSVPAP
jgi:prepilin-type N-terminal cleavage/methylation domain-containing protein